MTAKGELNARVKITAGPVAGAYGRIAHVNNATWRADVALDDGRLVKGIALVHVELIADEAPTDRAKLLERIRKLWAKAESLKTMGPEYEHEALAFAANAQKMLNKYKLSLDDLAMAAAALNDPIDQEASDDAKSDEARRRRTIAGWALQLAKLVATAHFCRALPEIKSERVWFVGRASDRRIAIFVYTTLRRAAVELSDAAARRFRKQQRAEYGETTPDARNYRSAWLSGFVDRIAERYRDEERAMATEKNATGTSLITLRGAALVAADEFTNKHIKLRPMRARSGRASGETSSANGRRDGARAADSVRIRGTALDAAPSSTSKLLR